MLAAVLLHIVTTIILVKENRVAKGGGYEFRSSVQAKVATRLMALSGIILLSYIVFHLLHFTTHSINPAFAKWEDGEDHDVWAGVIPLRHVWGPATASGLTAAGTSHPASVQRLLSGNAGLG